MWVTIPFSIRLIIILIRKLQWTIMNIMHDYCDYGINKSFPGFVLEVNFQKVSKQISYILFESFFDFQYVKVPKIFTFLFYFDPFPHNCFTFYPMAMAIWIVWFTYVLFPLSTMYVISDKREDILLHYWKGTHVIIKQEKNNFARVGLLTLFCTFPYYIKFYPKRAKIKLRNVFRSLFPKN